MDPEFTREALVAPAQRGPAEQGRLLSLRVEPGFRCFFREWVEREKVSVFECYDQVLKSHLQLERLRWPAERVVGREELSLGSRAQELLARATEDERFFAQGRREPLLKNSYAREREERIKQLEMQVELYRRRREEALEAKREQFRKAAGEQEEAQRRLAEERARRQKVLAALKVQQ